MADEEQDRLLNWGEVRKWLDNAFGMPIGPSTIDVWITRGRIKADGQKRVWESHLKNVFPKSQILQIIREEFDRPKGRKKGGGQGDGGRKPSKRRARS